MTPIGIVYVVLSTWTLVFALALVLPIATGKIKFGAPGSPPIERSVNPGGFWGALALSALGLIVVLLFMRLALHSAMPGAWDQAMEATGLARLGL